MVFFFFGTKCDIYDYGNYRHLLSICILLGSKSLEQLANCKHKFV